MEHDERIEALETKLSYQEAALADMSALVNEYRLRVERLEGTLKDVSGKLRELDDGKDGGLPQSERPPHY
ncbi:MAG TPA: hypothetical protein DCG47_00695 [Spirochaetaceae bacterium]|jgi:uncharacterized coiled-coil protein SlyX|nr:hypothetical protein [Spirochaetaceae bacterium]